MMRGGSSWLRPFPAGERGQATVEFAVLLPVLILVLFAFMEFGRFFSANLVVQNAAREGVRLGVTGATDQEIEDKVRSGAGHLEGAAHTGRLTVTVTPAPNRRVPGRDITVTVKYKFGFVVPLIVEMFPIDQRVDGRFIWLTSRMTMRI